MERDENDQRKPPTNSERVALALAITALKVSGRIVYHEVKGKAGSHYEPVTLAGDTGDTQPEICDMEEDEAMTLAA